MLGVELRYLVLLMLTLWLQKISAIEGAKEDRVPFCPGNDLTLKCAVKAGIPRVWMYRGANEVQKLARVENKRVQYYPNLSRIFGLRASVKSNGSLVIRSTVGSDEGTYVCENEAHERVLYDLEFNCRGKVTHETLNVCTPTDTEGSVFVPCEARRRVKQNNTDWLVWNINQERLVYFDDGGLIWNVKFKGMARIIDTNTGTLALSTASEILTQWLGGGFEMNLTCYVSKLDAGTSERHRVRVKPIDCNYQIASSALHYATDKIARKAKKRSGFKGKPAWKKKAEESVPKLVFVADCDVAEENDEPEKGNPISASKRKLSYSESDEEYSLNEVANAEGYRVVFMDSLRDIAQRIHGFSGCEGKVSVVEDPSECFGLCSSLFIQCDSCDLNEFFSTGKHSLSDLGPTAWATRNELFYQQHLVAMNKQLEKSKAEEKELCKNNGMTPTSVSFDGTWAKRGFTSNHGVGFAISTKTGKSKKLSVEEFEQWAEDHECPGGYEGSSPSMETSCAKKIWNNSKDTGLEYRFMVSDGDSKAFGEVRDTYGVCEDCLHYDNMDKSSPEYKQWKNSPAYKRHLSEHMDDKSNCCRVMKLDCVRHVQKRMGKALRKAQETKGKLADGKPVGGRSGRPAIEKLQKYYGNAIRNNVKQGVLSTNQRAEAISNIKMEIMGGLYHSCKLPVKKRHQFCPVNSFCAYKNLTKTFKEKKHHLDPVFVDFLKPTYDRLTSDALLERCLPGNTQNPNERLNSLVWLRCPKQRWFGRKRVEMAAVAAALHFSSTPAKYPL
ncbi:predicted protein [Nematostella vectensis]|uniref:Ig-like domain-containing protein n=1 Tax=Nematostella vectensis TaxID=45351 RepID=A7S2V6_NEMVE|nr:predicted protein [Nematostella vectensis]|eukprot:XP_001634019.1 predicted protein [Nematostella vectensis]